MKADSPAITEGPGENPRNVEQSHALAWPDILLRDYLDSYIRNILHNLYDGPKFTAIDAPAGQLR